jgi:hypothetical protein
MSRLPGGLYRPVTELCQFERPDDVGGRQETDQVVVRHDDVRVGVRARRDPAVQVDERLARVRRVVRAERVGGVLHAALPTDGLSRAREFAKRDQADRPAIEGPHREDAMVYPLFGNVIGERVDRPPTGRDERIRCHHVTDDDTLEAGEHLRLLAFCERTAGVPRTRAAWRCDAEAPKRD